MNRRISKSNTNYQYQKYYAQSFLKKHSFDGQKWHLAAIDAGYLKPLQAHSLNLFFDNPQTLLNYRRLQHYTCTQRLREGVYILFKGRIRVLLTNPSKNSSKVDIQHAIHKMENSSKFKVSSNKLYIIQVFEPFQLISCTNNCLALPNTECWYISHQQLVHQHYMEKRAEIVSLLSLNAKIFTVNNNIPFMFRLICLNFRSIVDLAEDIQLAIIKKGNIRIQWKANPCQQLIVAQGNVLIKRSDYVYSCQSSQAELVGIQSNKAFKYIDDPLWTKSPQTSPPVLQKQRNPNERLLFRSRSINLQRLTAHGDSRPKNKKSISLQKDHKSTRFLTVQTTAASPSYREVIKQNWLFMRKVQNYEVASNTRSEMEYQRIQALRLRFKKEREKSGDMRLQNEMLLAKKKPKGKIKFIKFKVKDNDPPENSHLLLSVNSFFKKELNEQNK